MEPLNEFQNTLRARLKKLGQSDAIVAQRIKRKPTILEKLQRFRSMRLDQMDGIGGIRAFVFTLLILSLGQSKFTFFLADTGKKCYISDVKLRKTCRLCQTWGIYQ